MGSSHVAEFPVGVTQAAQYGNQTKASSVYLSQFQLVPLDRVRDYFEDQAGIAISKGSIANFNVEASRKLEKFEVWAKKQLAESKLNHADETGINVGGKKLWLHNLSNAKVTLFHADEKRGKDATDPDGEFFLFLKESCATTIGSPILDTNARTRCATRIIFRELQWAVDFENQEWAERMKRLLTEIQG